MRIALFLTCTADALYPSVGRSCVNVLEALGIEVDFPSRQTCCGQPWVNMGQPESARRLARHFLEVFKSADAVVGISSSCVDTVRNQYPELFADVPALQQRFRDLGQKTYEFCEFLEKVAGLRTLPAHPRPQRTTYHASCRTLRGIGLHGTAERYLTQMFGEDFVALPESEVCCGFGGSFSVKLPEISGRLMHDKLRNIVATGALQVASLDLGCLTHLAGGAGRLQHGPVRFAHLAELMAEALQGSLPCR